MPPATNTSTCSRAAAPSGWARQSAKAEFGPGELLFFERGTVHAIPEIIEEPLVFLSVDTPRRIPTDIIFVDPNDGTPATFMARNAENG